MLQQIDIISILPEMFTTLKYGVTGRAIAKQVVNIDYWNPRNYAEDAYGTVDDRPYGGGPGMVMKAEPLKAAIHAARQNGNIKAKVIYVTPQGRRLEQVDMLKFAANQRIIFIAGRYEGIDERIIATEVDEEVSIGDYVLSGGELAIMVIIDSVLRLLPGVLGHEQSAEQDSFVQGLLDCPHYTRPEIFADIQVPKALLSGDHKAIKLWRQKQALGRTWLRRPDLIAKIELSDVQKVLLQEFIKEYRD